MSSLLRAVLVVGLAALLLTPFATSRAQDKKEGLHSLIGKEVRAVIGHDGPNSADVRFTIDALEPEGVWASNMVVIVSAGAWPKDVSEHRYFFPWSSIGSIRLEKDKK